MSRRTRIVVAALAGIAILAGAAVVSNLPRRSPIAVTPSATPGLVIHATSTPVPIPSSLPPRPVVGYTPVPDGVISPVVIQRSPETGQEQPPDGPIELVFDRPMSRASVESAFQIYPAVAGTFNWINDQIVQFQPSAELARAGIYDVVIDQGAQDTDGAPLNQAYQFRFAAAGYLEVAQVIPAPGAADVDPSDTLVTIIFNRPVVPLTSLQEQSRLPQPFTLSDGSGIGVAGKGEWLNTSIFVFRASGPLAGGVTYTGRVSDLTDTDGNPMQSDFAWTFTTAPPEVVWVTPAENASLVPIETAITVQFNQPVDPESARSRFSLVAQSGQTIDGAFSVVSDTLIFTPTNRLDFDTTYRASVDAGVTSRAGGQGSRQARQWLFSTVPLPRILRTDPADGQRDVPVYTGFTIYFNAPIDPDTVMPNLRMTPPFSPTATYTYFNTYDNSFALSYDVKPSTDYVVEIGPNIADPYGNTTGQSLTVRYRTAELPPSLALNVPGQVATYNANDPVALVATHTNVERIDLNLYALSTSQALDFQRDSYNYRPASAPMRSWSSSIDSPPNEVAYTRIEVTEGGARLAPGFYLLDATSPDIPPDQFYYYGNRHLLVVSQYNVVLKTWLGGIMVWVTDLRAGRPAPDISLTFYDYENRDIARATTGSDGTARVAYDENVSTVYYAIAEAPFTAGSTSWSSGIGVYDFGIQPVYYGSAPYNAFIYTDRPIYRPGQTVNFKGIVRAEDDVKYRLPDVRQVHVKVYDAAYTTIYEKDLDLNELATFHDALQLDAGASLGAYQIEVTFRNQSFGQSFSVAAYRPPEFEIVVTPERDEIARGEASRATAQAKYFFGGGLANTSVNWNVLAETYHFQPPWGGPYTFSDVDDPWICFDCWWYAPYSVPEPILSGSGTTDAEGKITIDIPADLQWSSGEPITRSVRLIVEATASGPDNQFIAGRGEIIRHQGDLYVGLATRDYVAAENRPTSVDLVVVDWIGTRIPNTSITISTFRREWINTFVENEFGGGTWEYTTQDTLVDTTTVATDDKGDAVFTFTPADPGSYHIVAEALDNSGRMVRASTFLWVYGREFVSWRRENNDRLTLISDKSTYVPGETAEILIPSPFQGEQVALVTIERGGVLRSEVLRLTSNSTVYQLPITSDLAPNIYFSVVLVKGQKNCAGVDCLKPENLADYKIGLLPLDVTPIAQTLNIKLVPSVPSQGTQGPEGTLRAQPGEDVTYDVVVSDANGQPVAGEFSLDLVDKAVLSLLPRTPDAIVQGFYSRRGLGVSTSSGLAVSGNRLLEQIQQAQAGLAARAIEAPAAAMPTAPPAAAESAADAFGAAGAPLPPGIEIREEFADTAYWNPTFTTDANGRGAVTIRLPDNLTTWTFRGVGVTADTKVGEATVDVVATKPLLIRPVAPRFFVVGDRAILAANVSNNTDTTLAVDVSLTAEGVTFNSDAVHTVTIPPRSEAKVEWDVTVSDVENVQLIFAAVSGDLSDASKPRLTTGPDGSLLVFRYSAPDIVGTGGQLERGDQRTEVVALPPKYDDRQGDLSVRLDASLAAAAVEGLDYLEHFPYECTEQTVSRFLPNVLTYRALKELGVDDPELEAKLPGLVQEGLDKLYTQQRDDGGWGWWPEARESNAHLTAYVVYGLMQARNAGFEVRSDVIERGQQFLIGSLRDLKELGSFREANQQAFVLFVLAEDGRAPADRLDDTFEAREELSHYARAFLAMAIETSNPSDARLQTLLSDLNSSAILSATGAHWEENDYDWWAMNTDTRSTAIILAALARLDPGNALNPNVVRWLMVARHEGIWETTQETAWALIGLTDWMALTGELNPNYDYAAFLNDAALAEGRFTPENVRESVQLKVAIADLLQDAGNRLTIARGDGEGRLYYTAHLKVYLPVEEIDPVDRGIVVSRRYTLASCEEANRNECPEVTEAKVGDVIRVDLTIVAKHDLYYLVVEDPLPAGAEAIYRGLATTSLLEQGPILSPVEFGGIARPYYEAYWWWWNWYSRSELRDEKVVLFADYLAKGTYEYSYTMRATLPGEYRIIPTVAQEFYFPEVFGRSDGRLLRIGK